ncbi:alpha/beta hydrolase [Antrihabitans cavernicola]|uniref:Monoacylglycerol lipase n=1 Tax=Antrihabitans cavernicola TaxID=2495913 RepID=A0A5A7SA92_9NOCA|nr:alpha/beta hydrolase [Spelaeibacter cavernicola]KAA0023070.1 lysophospholipase [Spelaeibacter cavernicola]
MTDTIQGDFDGSDGKIKWRAWIPDDTATAVVILVHGIAEHSGRYQYVGERLAAAGYAVYAPDHHGHGLSEGHRANIGTMDGVADDVQRMMDCAIRRHPEAPRFVLGHSLGGLIALYYVTRSQVAINGLVISAAAIDVPVVSGVQRVVGSLLSKVAPNAGALKLDSAGLSRDPAVIADYDSDQLNFRGKIPVRTLTEGMHAIEQVQAGLPKLTVPLLILHGEDDPIVAVSGSRDIAKQAGSDDVTLKVYPGLLHEILNEPEKDQVIGDIVGWLDQHR